jgi:undecaprenyl-diphosphatase
MHGQDFQSPPPWRVRGGLAVSHPVRPHADRGAQGRALYAALICLAGTVAFLMLRLDAQDRFDRPLFLALNQFAGRWPAVDRAALILQEFNLPKGGLIFALAAGAFAVRRGVTSRTQLVLGCVAASLAAVASRASQMFLPNLPRPLFDPALHFTLPLDADAHALHDWSSFPSDNAALLFGVTLAVWFADRRMGALAFGVFLAGALARVYGGLHYPTDMLGGGALSAAFVFAARSIDLRVLEDHREALWRYRALWASLIFLCVFQAASLFDDLRAIAALIRHWS